MEKGQSLSQINRAMLVAEEKESTMGVSATSSLNLISTGGSDPYDVFLSFCGSDTRKGFTDCLYYRLVTAGICVFRDRDSIPHGKEFGSWLFDAITLSKISIPIISENYASSKWCLRELIYIMDHKNTTSHVVLPIFYKVNPSDVRYLEGHFGEAFHSGKKYFEQKEIEEGPRALEEVSYLTGEVLGNRHEGELIELVVKTVLSELRKYFQLRVPEELVGLDGHLKRIMNWMDNPSVDARMIGIFGMGGIGKTTLAKCIYNQLSSKFEHVSFLPNIRENTRCYGIKNLQSQLISNILQSEIQVSTVDEGINLIKSRFKGKKVLILLDDVDHKDQLNDLAKESKWFASGSIIIVTTRNREVLDQSKFKVNCKYELTKMDWAHSSILFSRHAFRMDHPSRKFTDISHDIISTMGGLPLALEVIGSYLYGKTELEVWNDMLEKLKKQPHGDVEKILKISYDALEEGHKEIFLDIACFFIGRKSKIAIYMWNACKFYASQGILELKLRCLIKIGEDGELEMHDQLRDLGRNIICQGLPLERRSRLWVHEEASMVLMEEKGTETIEAICLEGYHGHLQTYTDEQFKKLRSLRYLQLKRVALSGDFSKLFSKLRWLQWFGIELNPSFLAIKLHLPELVVLQLSCKHITDDWRGWRSIMAAKRLKVLDLASCEYLTCTIDLSGFTELEILILKDCYRLEQVHHSIGKVKHLVSLDLSGCGNLKELPEEVGELEELKELILDSAGIIEIPMSIGSLRKLEKLSVRACRSLRKIPSSIWDLKNLQDLDISESPIEMLPNTNLRLREPDLSAFTRLEILILKDCYRLEQIHPSIGKVKRLIYLDLSGCSKLKELPKEVGELQELKELLLDFAGITEIPRSIGFLRKLEKLSAYGCQSLREIPSSIGDLQNLQHLDISDSAISDLPKSIHDLSSLEHLSLWNCSQLKLLPELPSGLKYLRVSCQSPTFSQFSSLIHLEKLDLSYTRST